MQDDSSQNGNQEDNVIDTKFGDDADVINHTLVAAIAIYTKDGELKQRTVNVMLEHATPNITKADLNNVTQGVFQRVHTENGVADTELKDIVILNVCRLAVMSSIDFHGSTTES